MEIKVTKLNLFPIKSCHGLQVEEVKVGSHGVEDDRRFMLVDGNKRFVSQRKFSKLTTVHSKFVLNEKGERMMHVSSPGMERELQFVPVLVGERTEVSIWEDRVKVVDQGEEPAQWFSEFIGHGGSFIRLVASAESNLGNTGTAATASGEGNMENFHRVVTNLPSGLREKMPAMQLALADDGPISLVSHESLADVNARLRERGCEDVPLDRFRMNIEISGCSKPFEEDDWLLIRIGDVPFLLYTNAERCKVTGINQDTGEQDKLGPLEILRTYRAPRGPTHAMFGQLLIALQPGVVRVGDKVQVLDKKKRAV